MERPRYMRWWVRGAASVLLGVVSTGAVTLGCVVFGNRAASTFEFCHGAWTLNRGANALISECSAQMIDRSDLPRNSREAAKLRGRISAVTTWTPGAVIVDSLEAPRIFAFIE